MLICKQVSPPAGGELPEGRVHTRTNAIPFTGPSTKTARTNCVRRHRSVPDPGFRPWHKLPHCILTTTDEAGVFSVCIPQVKRPIPRDVLYSDTPPD